MGWPLLLLIAILNDLGVVPTTAFEFLHFYQARRDRIRERLISLLSRGADVPKHGR